MKLDELLKLVKDSRAVVVNHVGLCLPCVYYDECEKAARMDFVWFDRNGEHRCVIQEERVERIIVNRLTQIAIVLERVANNRINSTRLELLQTKQLRPVPVAHKSWWAAILAYFNQREEPCL